MTRARRWIFAALFLLAGTVLVTWATRAAWLALSAYTDFWADQELCEGTSPDVDAQIAACTRQIGSGHFWGHDLAIEYYNRGIAWKAKGDLDRAIADYDQAIRLEPKHEHAYYNRGVAWSDKGDLDRAIADYDQALQLDPKDADPYVNRGVAWKAKGDLDRAIADYTEAILLDPANANNFNSRCWCRALDGKDLNAALGDCNESLRLRPNDGNTLNSRGLVQFKVGAFDAAIADYNTAVAQNAKDADSLYARGVAKLKKGDTAGRRYRRRQGDQARHCGCIRRLCHHGPCGGRERGARAQVTHRRGRSRLHQVAAPSTRCGTAAGAGRPAPCRHPHRR